VKRIFRIGEDRHELLVLPHRSGRMLRIGAHEHVASLRALGPGEYRVEIDGVARRAWIAVRGDAIHIHLDGRSWTLESIDELAETSAHGGSASDTAEAPMPGTVVRVQVEAGDAVKRGQTLVVIESMKMETAVVAWRDGIIAAVHRPLGATFDRKAPLVSLEPEPAR
jgi:acetyl/propionyl-CoA carboxylase alpha subunit